MQPPVTEVFNLVKSHFIGRTDRETRGVGDYWDHFADCVRAGRVAERDCEDFGLTCLIIGTEDYGWDLDKCRLARVLTPQSDRSKPFDHCVAIYDGWVLDNLLDQPVKLEDVKCFFYDYTCVPMAGWCLYESGQQFLKNRHH